MESVFDDGRRPLSLSYKSKINNEYIPILSRSMKWTLTDLKKHDIENGKKEAYSHDSAYRLRQVENVQNNTTYEYEIDGVEDVNRFTKTQNGIPEIKETVCNERHQLVQYNGMDLAYDKNGNLTHFKHNYVYNWKNQLVKVITGSGVNVEYKYDALGRRIVKKVKDPNSETVTRYVHDGYQVIEERNGSDQVLYRYTYGNGIDERIEIEKSYEDENNNIKWKSYLPLHDSIGNVTALTDDKGKVIEKYNYSPYGEVTYSNTESAPGIDNIRIENGKIRIRFDRQVDLDKIAIHLYIKVTQEVIAGTSTIESKAREIWHTPSIFPEDETLTIKLQAKSGPLEPGEPIEIFSHDFEYHGEQKKILHDSGPPRVDRVISAKDEFTIVFSEDVEPGSVTDSVELKNGAINVTGTIEKVGENEYKFIPDESLSEQVLYSLGVSGVKDLVGKTMTGFNHTFIYNENLSLVFNYSILTENDESIVGNNSLFHGRTYEPEVGLYYYRNRYYHSKLGRFLQQDPMGYADSMNLYQAFGMNPVNFVDPFGTIANPEYDPLAVQSAYMQFRHHYGSHSAAMKRMYHYKYAIRSGVNDTMRLADTLYENALAQSYYYDALDTTPGQFAKDALAGTINVGFEMMSWGFKIMSMGEPKACEKIDKIKTSVQGGVIKILGARKNSIGYMAGTFYGPAVAGGVSAGLSSKAGKVVDIADFPEDTLSVSKSGSKVPWEYGELDDALGATDKFGNITIKKGVTGKELVDTLRHESVHRFFSPKSGLFKELRANIGMSAYNRSHLVRFLEEGIAETYATGNFMTGFTFPLYGYGIKKIRLVAETVIYVGLIVSSIYSGKLLLNGR
jgi:RHS repeat-associated protein